MNSYEKNMVYKKSSGTLTENYRYIFIKTKSISKVTAKFNICKICCLAPKALIRCVKFPGFRLGLLINLTACCIVDWSRHNEPVFMARLKPVCWLLTEFGPQQILDNCACPGLINKSFKIDSLKGMTHALATSTDYAGRRPLPWLACNVARA